MINEIRQQVDFVRLASVELLCVGDTRTSTLEAEGFCACGLCLTGASILPDRRSQALSTSPFPAGVSELK